MTASPTGPRLDERGLPEHYSFREGWEITPRQLKAMLDAREPVVLLDCRTPAEHEYVRLPDARLIPLQEAMNRLEELKQLADKRVVVHCHHGVRSLQMTALLRQLGVTDALSLAGGIGLCAIDIEPGMVRY